MPPGFAHGFLVVSDHAEVQYKTTDYWAPQHERYIIWNDRDLATVCNLADHKVSFQLATTVFRDPLAITVYDEEHSEDEERWATLGQAGNGQYLVVIHTFRQTNPNDANIRLISAREATRREIRDYEEAPR